MSESEMMAGKAMPVAFMGFGEAAMAFVSGWTGDALAITAYDIKTDAAPDIRERKLADYEAAGVNGCDNPADALARADAVFSLVTADQALDAARMAAAHLPGDAFFLDCNSCSPQTKQEASRIIDAVGGRYVDVAVMAPVHPHLNKTPLLVSGPHAGAAMDLLQRLEMVATHIEGEVGKASAIKLVRSIMVKGLEALAAECLTAGRLLGVDDIVLASLEETFPGFGWDKRTARMLERMMVHGTRRAAEMTEAALMVEALGLPNRMAKATALWEQQIGGLDLDGQTGEQTKAARAQRADAILEAFGLTKKD